MLCDNNGEIILSVPVSILEAAVAMDYVFVK